VIDPTGKVLADSEADPSTMENHAHRKEFVTALGGEVGIDERNSQTVNIPFVYVAAPVSGGAVRLAYPLPEVEITDRPLRVALFWGRSARLFSRCWWRRRLRNMWACVCSESSILPSAWLPRLDGQNRVQFDG